MRLSADRLVEDLVGSTVSYHGILLPPNYRPPKPIANCIYGNPISKYPQPNWGFPVNRVKRPKSVIINKPVEATTWVPLDPSLNTWRIKEDPIEYQGNSTRSPIMATNTKVNTMPMFGAVYSNSGIPMKTTEKGQNPGKQQNAPPKSQTLPNFKESDFCLSATLDTEFVPHSPNQVQNHGLMVSIEESAVGSKNVDTCKADIVCVIDVSGSMGGSKIENVRKTLKTLLNLISGSRIALVIFDTQAELLMNFKIVNKWNIPSIKKVIHSLHKKDKTNITAAIRTAQNALGNRLTSNPVSAMFLLSDGKHNVGQCNMSTLFGGGHGPLYTLHTYGYGDDHDAHLMQSMAQSKGGNYYFISDINRVDECFMDSLGLVMTTMGTAATIKVKFAQSSDISRVVITKTYGAFCKAISEDEAEFRIHNLYAGMKKDFMIDVQLVCGNHPINENTEVKIGEITLKFNEAEGRQTHVIKKAIKVHLRNSKTNPRAPSKDYEVLKNMLRVRGAEVFEKAEEFRRSKRYNDAIVILSSFLNLVRSETLVSRDILIISLIANVEKLIRLVENEMKGIQNKERVESMLAQNKNFYMNQQSAPMHDKLNQFSNKRQVAFRSYAINNR